MLQFIYFINVNDDIEFWPKCSSDNCYLQIIPYSPFPETQNNKYDLIITQEKEYLILIYICFLIY